MFDLGSISNNRNTIQLHFWIYESSQKNPDSTFPTIFFNLQRSLKSRFVISPLQL